MIVTLYFGFVLQFGIQPFFLKQIFHIRDRIQIFANFLKPKMPLKTLFIGVSIAPRSIGGTFGTMLIQIVMIFHVP